MKEFITKDSGKRKEFSNGFVRDLDDGKLRYDLIPLNMLSRLAGLYTRGIQKYGEHNRQQARGRIAIERFKQSAWRHFVQWQNGEVDEDHSVGTCRNIFAYERHKERMEKDNLQYADDGITEQQKND